MKNILAFIVCILGLTTTLWAQHQRLVVMADRKAPSEFLAELSLQTGVNIIYSDNVIEKLPEVTLQMKDVTLEDILTRLLHGSGIGYTLSGDQVILYRHVVVSTRYTVSGVVSDSVSGEPLISAYVYDALSGKSTSTNNYGFYSLTLPQGRVELLAGYLNYSQKNIRLELQENKNLPLRLHPDGLLKEVIVHADRANEKDVAIVPPAERVTLNDLQSHIHLGGSSDLYRTADFIPGVHTGTDGVGGIHVRGGANDQNLILMDGVPVYHPNHLLGIVSVFNYQVLQQASIYKANFPSRFSGRLSSVMDVRTREGNIHQWGFSGNVGVSELGLMAEGPLVKDKISILVSGRFFLPGLFMPDITRRYKKRNGVGGTADLDYYDFNGKINWRISEKDRIYLSMYRGQDKFSDLTQSKRDEVDQDSGLRVLTDEEYDKRFNWSNRTAVLRWNHILSDQIFANFILSTSRFVLQSVDRSEINYSFPGTNLENINLFDTKEFKSGIEDVTAKIELDIRPAQDHTLTSGLYAIRYKFQPKSITINEESKVGDFYLDEGLIDDIYFSSFRVRAVEAGFYMEDKWNIDSKLILSSGLHFSGFYVQGIHYLDPQLRLSLDYLPDPKLGFNIGYSRMAQYLHNLTSSSIGLPTDLWVPTTAKVSPALSDQYAISGRWRPVPNFTIDLSAYVKNMRSLISYQEGASFLLPAGILPSSIVDAANWESRITEGVGNASGVEMQLAFEHKRFQSQLNGTWSRSYRTFDEINNGRPFPDRYDRRWSATFSSQMKVGAKWSFGVDWVYGTGIAITLAESKFFNPGALFPVLGISYSERNAYRLPPYHRLDMNVTYTFSEKAPFTHSLTLNLYNVYNRINPFYITLVQDPITSQFEFRQFSLFKFFPSVSYRFSFQ